MIYLKPQVAKCLQISILEESGSVETSVDAWVR